MIAMNTRCDCGRFNQRYVHNLSESNGRMFSPGLRSGEAVLGGKFFRSRKGRRTGVRYGRIDERERGVSII